jgi:myo-inositol-1(or 4)-monophosphatase
VASAKISDRALGTLLRQAADAAASVIRAATPARTQLDWRTKAIADFVTEVDIRAEASAIEILSHAEPDATIVAEESWPATTSALPSNGLCFIIDPLDGTTNFLHGFPEYAVSIAAMVDGRLTAGVVLNVPRGDCYTAIVGDGTRLDGARVHVSIMSDPARALIGTGFPFRDRGQIPRYLTQLARVMEGTAGVRRAGAASLDLASVAAGRFEAFWENILSPWDVAAGILLVREAGGACTDPDGNDSVPAFASYVAGNPAMHAWLLRTLHDAEEDPVQ